MSEYLILAENISFKNNKLTCINIYDQLTALSLPDVITFDLAVLCGPNWSTGEHKLLIKAVGSNGQEASVGTLDVNIPNENFVYNAYANDLKITLDYSVENITFVVYDNEKEIISRKYSVVPFLVPKEETKNS